VFSVLLNGCAVGPDFTKPESPKVASYGPNGMPSATNGTQSDFGGIQRFQPDGDVPASWWTLFQSAELTHLITRAVQANPTLDAARASLHSAEETAAASRGAFFPSIDGSATTTRSQTTTAANPYSIYNASVSVGYAPDIFGGTRREVEASHAQAEAASFELEAAYLTLTSNVVATAIQEASLREQLAATKDIVEIQKKQLDIMKTQLDAGAIARPAYLQQQTAVANSEATIPPLENALAQTGHLMSTLLGSYPNERAPATFSLASFKLPEALPVTLPSNLVEQRPDIRAARANLQAANAQIGIATAAMMPQFPLSASYGVSARQLSDMFSPGTALWGLAAGITQPLFHGGELLHKKRAVVANFDKSAATYRGTVLTAFKEVADVLSTLQSDANALNAQVSAERSAGEALDLVTKQYNAGAVSYVELLNAQSAYQQAKLGLIKAKASRLSDTAALFQALGGGWWNRSEDIKSIQK
jgi:NodT family efflux transporter outer membrane factor (OMF) lipoprotein